MKATLTVRPYLITPSEQVIEVTFEGRLVCTVVGSEGAGVRIISKHRFSINADAPHVGAPDVPGVVEVTFPEA